MSSEARPCAGWVWVHVPGCTHRIHGRHNLVGRGSGDHTQCSQYLRLTPLAVGNVFRYLLDGIRHNRAMTCHVT